MTNDARDGLEPYGDTLDLRRLVRGLARSTRWIVVCLGLGAVVGLAAGIARPNQYVSEGKIEVRLGARERRTPEGTLDPTREVSLATPGLADEIQLLYNPELYERIARKVGPERLLAPYDPAASDHAGTPPPLRWLHELQSWWFRRQAVSLGPDEAVVEAGHVLMDAIEVNALSNTSYLLVRSTSFSPELAQAITRAYVSTAREWHREVYASRIELSFVGDQLKRYEEEASDAARALKEHLDTCGFYDLENQKNALVAALDDHEKRIDDASIRAIEIGDELDFVERELERTPATVEKLIPPSVKMNPEYQARLGQLQRLTSERTGLITVYTEGSEIFQRKAEQLDAEIARVEKELSVTKEFTEFGEATREESPNPRHEELVIRRDELRLRQETLTKTRALLANSRAETDVRLNRALLCQPVHRDLVQAVERSKGRVLELSAALERAQALALLDRQEDMDSLRIAQEGDLPRRKAGPERARALVLGLFGGLAAGLFLAALRFLADRRVRDADTLEEELGLKVITVVPETRSWRRAGAKARRRRPYEVTR